MTDKKQETPTAFPSLRSVDILREAIGGGPPYDELRTRAAARLITAEAKGMGVSCEQLVIEVKTVCRRELDPARLPPEMSTDGFTNRIVSECIKCFFAADGRP